MGLLATGIESFQIVIFHDVYKHEWFRLWPNQKELVGQQTEIIQKQSSSDAKLAGNDVKERPLTRACEDISDMFCFFFYFSMSINRKEEQEEKQEVIHFVVLGKRGAQQ